MSEVISVIRLKQQRGATLIIAMVLLVIITLISVSAMQQSAVEEKMSNNFHDHELAFQAAESALIEGQNWLLALGSEPTPVDTCGAQPCVLTLSPTQYAEEQTAAWWQSAANTAVITSTAINNVASQPRYYIEFYRFVPDSPGVGQGIPTGVHFYRVSARGVGKNASTQVIIQSTVARRF